MHILLHTWESAYAERLVENLFEHLVFYSPNLFPLLSLASLPLNHSAYCPHPATFQSCRPCLSRLPPLPLSFRLSSSFQPPLFLLLSPSSVGNSNMRKRVTTTTGQSSFDSTPEETLPSPSRNPAETKDQHLQQRLTDEKSWKWLLLPLPVLFLGYFVYKCYYS